MGMEKSQALLLVSMMMVLLLGASGIRFQGSKSSGVNFCNMSEDDLKTCKPSVTKPNPVDPPTALCCTALSKANMTCFCGYKDSMLLTLYGIDSGLAMALPAKCSLPMPATC